MLFQLSNFQHEGGQLMVLRHQLHETYHRKFINLDDPWTLLPAKQKLNTTI